MGSHPGAQWHPKAVTAADMLEMRKQRLTE